MTYQRTVDPGQGHLVDPACFFIVTTDLATGNLDFARAVRREFLAQGRTRVMRCYGFKNPDPVKTAQVVLHPLGATLRCGA